MFVQKRSWWRKKLSKKTIIIAASIALAVVAAIVIIIGCVRHKNDSAPKDTEKEHVAYDLEITGDAQVDPENAELGEEDGTMVETQELVPKEGRSNGIDVSKLKKIIKCGLPIIRQKHIRR